MLVGGIKTPHERRSHISAEPNLDTHHDYIVAIKGEITLPALAKGPAALTLRYIPDRFVIVPTSLGNYLCELESLLFDTLEAIATTILDDINNEIVARWVQVSLASPDAPHSRIQSHIVVLEDRQPGWNNPELLLRLRPF
jgi:7-cyano-7-deazaguanine reductase